MDEFLDHFFSSSSWSEANVAERASWIDNGPSETNGILPDSLGAYKGNGKNSPIPLIPSSHIIESLTTQGASMLGGGGISNYGLDKGLLPGDALTQNYGLDKGLLHGDALTQKEGLHCDANSSLPGMVNGNCKYMGVHLTNSTPNLSTVNHSSPELLSVVGSSAKSPHAPIESGSVGSNDSETSVFQPCLRDSQSLTSIPQLWPSSSYGDVSSLSPVMAQDKLPIFGLQGEYMDTDANGLGNRYLGDDKILQMGNLPASVHVNGHGELNNHCLSSFSTGQHNQLADMVGLHSQSQLGEGNTIKHYTDLSSVSQLPSTPAVAAGVCNGAAKPRMRARRGQATDPHSIAERLRREKISERMKNLQELVPNSNKTDKASMLDEIIEYVKFLQLQVKVLSMSRLGAAGAVVPLITDKAEGSNGLLLSQSDDQGSDPPLESPDYLSFEQEVVKLMESDVTIAMQFLQSKGLCIMPMALAAALSGSEALSCSISVDKKKPIFKNGPVHQNNVPGIGTNQMNSDGNDTAVKENVTGIGHRECIPTNGCNGTVIKQEEVNNSTCNAREMKP